MLEILEFVFRDGLTWFGFGVLLSLVVAAVHEFRPFRRAVVIKIYRATTIDDGGKD